MDTAELAPPYMTAGKEYVACLSRLGMDVSAAMWAYDTVLDEFVLVVLTDFFDVKGPLEISKVLFRAYNASLTPREIDPFKVRLHSLSQPFARNIAMFGIEKPFIIPEKPGADPIAFTGGSYGDLTFRTEWLVKASHPAKAAAETPSPSRKMDISRRFERFVRNVEQAAA